MSMSIDIGLLLLRAALGFLLFAHATQKVVGWFSGPGLRTASAIFEALGQSPGRQMALLAAACELLAAVLLVLGLVTPVGAAIAAGTMLVAGGAMSAKAGSRWNTAGGGEYPLVLALLAVCVAFTGAGSWSADALLGIPWMAVRGWEGVLIGLAAAGVAILAALGPLARTRRVLRSVAAAADRTHRPV
jgi:putative oxidoreductase